MEAFVKIVILFIVCSVFGWFLEVAYRSIRNKKLINPGFLTGPCLPIYGTGGVALYLICSFQSEKTDVWFIILKIVIAALFMTFLELVGGLFFLQVFNTRLWDYSKEKFNYKGVICLKFTCYWGLICALFYLLIYKPLDSLTDTMAGNQTCWFVFGVALGMVLVDMGDAFHLATTLRAYAKHMREIVNIDTIRLKAKERIAELEHKKKPHFVFLAPHSVRTFVTEKISDFTERKFDEKNKK